jgi:hypothetical protein
MIKNTSSRTSTTNQSEYNSTNISHDDRVAADEGAIVTRGNVNVLDGGAIGMAGEMGQGAIDAGTLFAGMGGNLAERGLGLANQSMQSTVETLQNVIASERDDSAQLSSQLVNMIPWAVAGLVAWSIFK